MALNNPQFSDRVRQHVLGVFSLKAVQSVFGQRKI